MCMEKHWIMLFSYSSSACPWPLVLCLLLILVKRNSDIQCHLSMPISEIESYKPTTKNITAPAHPYSLFALSCHVLSHLHHNKWVFLVCARVVPGTDPAADLHGLDARCGRYGSQTGLKHHLALRDSWMQVGASVMYVEVVSDSHRNRRGSDSPQSSRPNRWTG